MPESNLTDAIEEQIIVNTWLQHEYSDAFSAIIIELLNGVPMPSDANWDIQSIGEVKVDIVYVPRYGYMAQSHGVNYPGATVITQNCNAFLIEATTGNQIRRIVTLTDPYSQKEDGTPKVYGRYLLT